MSTKASKTPQEEFDEKYITTNEISTTFKISRSAVTYARQRGILPDPIIVWGSKAHVWLRDQVMPNLIAWQKNIEARNWKPAAKAATSKAKK